MGAKVKTTQATTLTPEQKALLDSQIRGVMGMIPGFNLGTGWGGPTNESYDPKVGYGGMQFNTGRPAQGGGPVGPRQLRRPLSQASPAMAALESIAIPGAPGAAGGAPGLVDPRSPAAYANRENLVTPVVNPFRRNLGG